jgi:hypothetical protein
VAVRASAKRAVRRCRRPGRDCHGVVGELATGSSLDVEGQAEAAVEGIVTGTTFRRSGHPFVFGAQDCSALRHTLLPSEFIR